MSNQYDFLLNTVQPNETDGRGPVTKLGDAWSALYVAATTAGAAGSPSHSSGLSLIGHLLAEGANPNDIDEKTGNTPLHVAVHNENIEVVKALLNASANVNIKNKDGLTPIFYALYRYQPDPVNKATPLNVQLFKISATTNNPTDDRARDGVSAEVLDALLKTQAVDPSVVDKNGNTPLHLLLMRGRFDFVEQLLQSKQNGVGTTVNAEDKEAVDSANQAKVGPLKLKGEGEKRLLTEKREKINSYPSFLTFANGSGLTPLTIVMLGIEKDWTNLTAQRIQAAAQAQAQAAAPNIAAAPRLTVPSSKSTPFYKCAKLILDCGDCGINKPYCAVNRVHTTPLLRSVERGDEDFTLLLLSHGASFSKK